MVGLLVMALVGFAAQLVDGSLGMGYGVTSSTLLLAAGLSPAAASAGVHLSEVSTSLVSGFSHWRFDNVDWRVLWRIGIPGAVGAFIGAVVLGSVSTAAARPWMAGALLALGVYVILRFTLGRVPAVPVGGHVRGRFLAAVGLVAGFIDASGGGGWGPVATPTLLATGRMSPRKVIGSISAAEFLVAVSASGGFLVTLAHSEIPWNVVAAMLIGGAVAAPLAAWLVRHAVPHVLGVAAGGLIVTTNVRTLLIQFEVDTRWWIYVLLVGSWILVLRRAIVTHRSSSPARARAMSTG